MNKQLVKLLIGFVTAKLTYLVLQHSKLLEKVVYWLVAILVHRCLAIEGEPLLNARKACTQSHIGEEHEVERQRSCQDGVTAEEVDLDGHGIAHPTEEVDVVPSLLLIAARRIVVDAYLMVDVAIELGVYLSIEDILHSAHLAATLGLEVLGIVQDDTVAIT